MVWEREIDSIGVFSRMAIILDYVGEIEGTKSRIAKSYEVSISSFLDNFYPQVRSHLERALEIYPGDATTWHILGILTSRST